MAATTLVSFPLESGRKLAERLAEPLDLKAALWLYLDDDSTGDWRLILASPLFDVKGPRAAYVVVQQYYDSNPEVSDLSLNSVTVTSPNDAAVKPIIEGLADEDLGNGRWFKNTVISGGRSSVYIEHAYIFFAHR